jgi:hypothetical protein
VERESGNGPGAIADDEDERGSSEGIGERSAENAFIRGAGVFGDRGGGRFERIFEVVGGDNRVERKGKGRILTERARRSDVEGTEERQERRKFTLKRRERAPEEKRSPRAQSKVTVPR